MSSELDRLVSEAKKRWDATTPAQREEMLKAQRESYARSVVNWPKPKFKYVNGIKVYDSYEDYCNG